MKIKSGDEVVVLKGKDKGKKGKVEKVFAKKETVVVSGVNLFKRHLKKGASTNKNAAGVMEIIKPLPAASLSLICSKCGLPTKAAYVYKNDKKVRICKKCKQEF
jgi:large subunit ribosomal protein L24